MENIGYAMRNEAARESLVWFNNIFELHTWTHTCLELLLYLASALALAHAYRFYKRTGSLGLVYVWLAPIVHGITWEILVFRFAELDVFWHGEFSVMLYHNRLPLYIILGFYPSFFYYPAVIAHRFGVHLNKGGRLIEACAVGILVSSFYVICETLSPVFQWWTWNYDHASAEPVWTNIPASVYMWCLLYGFSFGLATRYLFLGLTPEAERSFPQVSGRMLAAAVLIPAIPMLFLGPANVLSMALEQPKWAGVLMASYYVVAAWVFFLAPKRYDRSPDALLKVFPALWLTFMVVLYLYAHDFVLERVDVPYIPEGTKPGSTLIALLGFVSLVVILRSSGLLGRSPAERE
jgi:hypothetical protein